MLDLSIPEYLIELMEGSGFKAFISFGMYMLDCFSSLYVVLFVTKGSDIIIDFLIDIVEFLPGNFEIIVSPFLNFLKDNILDWTIFSFPIGFLIMGVGLVLSVVVSVIKLVWGFVNSILDIAL